MRKIPKIDISDSAADKLIKAGVGIFAFFFLKKAFGKAVKDNADGNLDTDPAAGQARALNAAMNPSGNNWMRSFDTTNTQAIYDVAAQITDLDAVRKYYSAQTSGRNLNDDLTSEIGADGYQKFLALATKGKTGDTKYKTVLETIPANMWVITKKEANVRKTPKLISKWLPSSNIVKLVPAGKAIGVTTGKFAFDEPNNVTFVEFYTLGAKIAGKHFFYVAKSQIELITAAEKTKRDKTAKIPLELLAGLNGVSDDFQTQAISIHPTRVYDEQFQPLLIAPRNIIIGFPIMTLRTARGEFTKVQTVQGNLRWVNAQDVRIENRI